MENQLHRLFSYGFRPLFLCTCLSGLILVPFWLAVLDGLVPTPDVVPSVINWHAHEMLFGFVGSAMGGFLLTAVANWTNRAAVQGFPLVFLVGCWLSARLVMAYDIGLPPLVVAAVDISYGLVLTCLMAREVVAARNTRNYKIVGVLGAFTMINAWFHAGYLVKTTLATDEMAIRGLLLLVVVMISIIGGRIIPAFTRNWLNQRKVKTLPVMESHFDRLVIGTTLVLLPCYAVAAENRFTGYLALLAGGMHLLRLARWQGHRTWRDPLVLVLHTGYAWVGIGLVLLGIGILSPGYTVSIGIHGLTIGAMAGLILAVSSRAALGHTNRPLQASTLMSIAFLMINVAALVRVASGLIPEAFLLTISGACWTIALLAFAVQFAPILLGPVPQVQESPLIIKRDGKL